MAEVVHGPTVASTSSPAQPASPEPWKLLGRDTPAGKALYKLYGGDFGGKTVGNQFNQRNRQLHEAKLAAGWSPPPKEAPPLIQKPTVNYPKFGRDKHPKEAPISYLPRRKPADQIIAEMEKDKERMRSERPNARGPLLDEKEKERCAMMMRYRGAPPAVTIEERAAIRVRTRSAKKSEREEMQELFNQVMQEIDERREFIRDMEAAGKLTREMQHQLRCEIKQRVEDLERLDRLINGHEDDARAKAGLAPSNAMAAAQQLLQDQQRGGSAGSQEGQEGGY